MAEITLKQMQANMEREYDDGPYYIENVVPGRGRYAFIGMAGAGKSTMVCHQVLHMSSGLPWMANKTRPCRVLWLNLNDEPADVLKKRMEMLRRGIGLDELPPNLMIVNQADWIGKLFGMHTAGAMDNTYRIIDEWQPDVFVIDSLRKFLPFKDQVMNVRPLHILSNEYPEMVQYYIHHAQQKGVTAAQLFTDRDPASYMANSSDLARDVDGYYIIRAFTKDNLLESIALRAVSKRYCMLPRPIKIDVRLSRRAHISPRRFGEPGEIEAIELGYGGLYLPELRLEQMHIIDILAKHDGSYGLSIGEIVEASSTAVAISTTYRHIEELYQLGWIKLVARGERGKRFYELTEEGRKNVPAL